MNGCKISSIRPPIPRWTAILLVACLICAAFSACAESPAATPDSPDAAKARILELDWNLSYTEDANELSELVSGFDFDCKNGLRAYLVAKDGSDVGVLEVLFFESETDARSAQDRLAERLSDSFTCGRSGAQVWYGSERAVEKYLGG